MTSILWLHSDHMGCGVYRCYTPALGMTDWVDSHFLLHGVAEKSDPERELDGIDVVVFQRAVGATHLHWMKMARRMGVKVVFEMDDLLFDVPRHNPAYWFWGQKSIQKLLRTELDLADGVWVSTRPLQEYVADAMRWPSSRVSVCHNHLHPDIWGPDVLGLVTNPYTSNQVVIGWQGSATHDRDFTAVLKALVRIFRDHQNVLVRFLGCVPLTVKDVLPGSRWQWSRGVTFDRYPQTMRYLNFDIGIAPVTDSRFNRAKSNLKWLEYSALGIPTVASRVYPYEKAIEAGEGFLAGSEDEWYETLLYLIDHPEARQAVGAAAGAHVWRDWGASRVEEWRTALRTLGIGGQDDSPELGRSTGTGVPDGTGGPCPAYRQVEAVYEEGEGHV